MRRRIILHTLAVALFLIVSDGKPAHADLVAPVYPGAVNADEELGNHQRLFEKAFYAREPIDEVAAFYEQNVGPMEEVRAGRQYQNVVRHPPKFKASLEPDYIGVRLFSSTPTEPATDQLKGMPEEAAAEIMEMMPDRCTSDHFTSLRVMARQLDHYDWGDFEAVCNRFEHIDWAYFQLTKERDDRGRPMRKDQALLAEQQEKLGMMELDKMDPEETARRMEELQKQGRYQEMADLARQLQGKTMKSMQMGPEGLQDNWEEWIAHLERVDSHAYRTMIRINRDPATWPDEPVR